MLSVTRRTVNMTKVFYQIIFYTTLLSVTRRTVNLTKIYHQMTQIGTGASRKVTLHTIIINLRLFILKVNNFIEKNCIYYLYLDDNLKKKFMQY